MAELAFHDLDRVGRRRRGRAWHRPPHEHILSHRDLVFAGRFFGVQDVRYWHLFSILTTPLRNTPLFDAALRAANRLDGLVLRAPLLRLLAWQVSFELVKR